MIEKNKLMKVLTIALDYENQQQKYEGFCLEFCVWIFIGYNKHIYLNRFRVAALPEMSSSKIF